MHPDKRAAIEWARGVLESNALILDTESTGLGEDAEICQIALIDMRGRTYLDVLIDPIDPIPEEATKIHGITNDDVAYSPTFKMIWPAIRCLVVYRDIVIFNAEYDTRIINQCLSRIEKDSEDIGAQCAMLQYAAFVGEPGRYGGYRWQKLPIAPGESAHGAVSDCRSTLALIKMMAATEL